MKKYTLFTQIFSGFIISIVIFTIILFIFFRVGLQSAIGKWEENSIKSIKDTAIKILMDNGDTTNLEIPIEEPIFVYDVNKVLIYSNRGSGKRNTNEKDYLPLFIENKLVGYLYTVKIHFMDNSANEQFSKAIIEAILLALLFSIFVVIVLSVFITKKISLPAKRISKFLENLTDDSLGLQLNIDGANELKSISLAVNNLSTRLSDERKIRRQWSSDIAHDLRTPVSALKAQFEAMSQGVLDINMKRVNQNLNEVLRMELLVEDLSELMRLEEPELQLYPGEINSDEFIKQISSRNKEELSTKNITLIIENTTKSFIGDEMLLHRGVSNLWNNAIRHTNIGGYIKFSITNNASFTYIIIENSGSIISKEDLDRVFDRLYRGEIARESKGSGLGLTITKKIVDLHLGTIDLTSDGNGTIFSIEIPN